MVRKVSNGKVKLVLDSAFFKAFDRQPKLILLLTLAFCFYDLFGRVIPNMRALGDLSVSRFAMQSEPRLQLDAATYEHYLERLSKYSVPASDGEPVDQVAASSDPEDDYWYSGLHRFRLQAVFVGSRKFAIMEKISESPPNREVLQLSIGDVFDGYTVDSISSTGIIALGPSGGRLELALFEPKS